MYRPSNTDMYLRVMCRLKFRDVRDTSGLGIRQIRTVFVETDRPNPPPHSISTPVQFSFGSVVLLKTTLRAFKLASSELE